MSEQPMPPHRPGLRPRTPKCNRRARVLIIAGAILIAVALIVTVILTTHKKAALIPAPSSPSTPPESSTRPSPNPTASGIVMINEDNAPPDVDGWFIGNDLGALVGLVYYPPGSGVYSEQFIAVDNSTVQGTVRSDWDQDIVEATQEVNGRATCGIHVEDPEYKTCYLDTSTPFGLLLVSTPHKGISLDTVIDFTAELAALLP